jgi:hypothetical protein
MSLETPNAAEAAQHVTNAYDSITIIDKLGALASLDTEQQDSLDRNKEHIRIMLDKTWFDDALTDAQRTELTTKSAIS